MCFICPKSQGVSSRTEAQSALGFSRLGLAKMGWQGKGTSREARRCEGRCTSQGFRLGVHGWGLQKAKGSRTYFEGKTDKIWPRTA